ncbi:MAG: LysR family transcriptional regulator [Archangiaceae bacterium]|nr:LysR family transcriptional regulator [Archangiaceae bacterium]
MDIDLLRGAVPFVAVAEERSFRRAATRLEVTPAAVSKAVQALERELGVALLTRTTRSVALTPAGEGYFERCRSAVALVQGGRDELEKTRRVPTGPLVLSAPFVVAPLLITGLGRLRERHPSLSVTLKVSDQLARLAEEKVDVAIRVGALAVSTLVSRKLSGTRLLTVASPEYLARRGTPTRLEHLDAHDCIGLLGPDGRGRPWWFASGPRPVRTGLDVDHGPTLIDAAVGGLGITQLFHFMVQPLLASGRLRQLLDHETAAGPDIHAVCAPGRRASANVRAAFDVLSELFERDFALRG